MNTILIVPGYGDAGPDHWQTLWQSHYPNCIKVVQDDWENGECNSWVKKLDQTALSLSGPIVVVAHSLGCTTVIHWVNTKEFQKNVQKVKGALLVGPCDPICASACALNIRGFNDLPLNKFPFKSIIVMSSNDPFCSLERGSYFADCLGSELIDVGPKGHLGSESNLNDWKEGQKFLERLLK